MNIPEGWPTDEMIEAGRMVFPGGITISPEYIRSIFANMLATAPTPPAPEVEPVGFLVRRRTTGAMTRFCQIEELSHWQPLGEITFLYTHPANDGLRKTAQAVLDRIDTLSKTGIGVLALEAELEYLRAELNKDKS